MSKRKSAVITGSTSGIGLTIAENFCASDVNVMLNGFGAPDQIEKDRARLESSYGVDVAYHNGDMTKPEEIADLIDTATREFGEVNIVVNNAGIQHVSPIEEFPVNKWDAIIAINMSSAFHTIRSVLPQMKQRKWGRIINIASAHGLVASPFKSAYVTAKHGMLGLTKTVALEVAEFGITVNAICPGYVRTPLVDAQIPDTAAARGIPEDKVISDVILAGQPTKEFVTTEQISAFALFLTSDMGASITGAALSIDGGWVAQ